MDTVVLEVIIEIGDTLGQRVSIIEIRVKGPQLPIEANPDRIKAFGILMLSEASP